MKSENGGHKHHRRNNGAYDYFVKTFLFVFIVSALAAVVAFAAFKPISSAVHKVEAALSMNSRDFELNTAEIVPIKNVSPCDQVAQLVCKDKGINVPVFYGLNRVSLRGGAGLSSKHSFFSDDDITVIAGYDETYFAALKLVSPGDIFTVTVADKTIKYKVKKALFDNETNPNLGHGKDQLVIYSIFSEFSEHSEECFYVLADKVSEEVVTNE